MKLRHLYVFTHEDLADPEAINRFTDSAEGVDLALLRLSPPGREDLDVELQTMLRLGASLSTHTVLEISHLAHRFAGGSVMCNGVLQRFFRDALSGTQHRETVRFVTQQCGQILSGTMPEGTEWGLFDLVVPEPR